MFSGEAIRLNCGGDAFVDGDTGFAWAADDMFVETFATASFFNDDTPITGAPDGLEKLYAVHRYSNDATRQLQYRIDPGVAGRYTVTLHFAETFEQAAGKRIFDIYINNQPIAINFDAFVSGGGASFAASTLTTALYLAPGTTVVTISFLPNLKRPFVSGIEVVQTAASTVQTVCM
jgi:hypothetical protein